MLQVHSQGPFLLDADHLNPDNKFCSSVSRSNSEPYQQATHGSKYFRLTLYRDHLRRKPWAGLGAIVDGCPPGPLTEDLQPDLIGASPVSPNTDATP